MHRRHRQHRRISIHALREEGDRGSHCAVRPRSYFYPRPPRGGRPCSCRRRVPPAGISIHALREEGDALQPSLAGASFYFYPRPPRGGRLGAGGACKGSGYFYPRPPRGGRRNGSWPNKASISYFYPRPPRGGRRIAMSDLNLRIAISIHALREEGDRNRCFRADRSADFYPRPPRGGRPVRFLLLHVQQDFYPRPPRGGRPRAAIGGDKQKEISIHALREEGDQLFARHGHR